MDTEWTAVLWQQFGAAIDMLENAVLTCPDALWRDRSQEPEAWYMTFHTLFWLDFHVRRRETGSEAPRWVARAQESLS